MLVLCLSAAPNASATIINITADSNIPQSVTGTDSLNVSPAVTLTSTTTTPAITWAGSTGTGPVVNNAGTIRNTFDNGASSGRAIDMNFVGTSSSFTLNNGSVSNSVAVISSGNDVFRINRSIGTGIVTVNNYGTMQSTGSNGNTNGQAIDFNANTSTTGTVTINNFASGVMSAADADGIRPGNGATINNYGKIQGNSTGDTGNDGIDYQDAGKSGTINNFGANSSISGARHAVTSKEALTVYNEGTIVGNAGSGMNIDTTTNTPIMLVTNAKTGRIIGNAVAGADADGIDIDRLATINNSGLIKASGLSTGPNLNEAIAIGGGTINNYAGGMIVSDQRAITVDDSNHGNAFGAMTIYNEGTITGSNGEAISITSAFANILTNKGIIEGSVTMGSGLDELDFFSGSSLNGLVDGGGGADTMHLLLGSATALGTLGKVTNVEMVSIDGGTWTFTGLDYILDSLNLNGGNLILAGNVHGSAVLGANIVGNLITNVVGNGFNIYYDPRFAANNYLAGRSFNLTDGGLLRPIPEPKTILLLLAGLALLTLTRGINSRVAPPLFMGGACTKSGQASCNKWRFDLR